MEYVLQHPAINRSTLGRPLFERSITHYSNSHQILLVGEGDFSFSLSLAIAFRSAENMVSTSLDSREMLLQLYGVESVHKTLSNLEWLGATILHGVDATTMENHYLIRRTKFHRIVYNFPHAGFYGKEENENVIEKHRYLLKMFFKNARTILRESGEIHVTHKAYGPYKRWELVKQAEECGLLLKESVPFTIVDYPRYTNRRGAGSKAGNTFSLGECRTYKFVLGPGLLYQQRLMGMPVALSKVYSGASVEGFNAVLSEPEPGRQMGMGWELERPMRIASKREPERQTNIGWEIEQMRMCGETMRMGWETEVERQRRMGWEHEQMRMSMGCETTRMGWETKAERQGRMCWEHEQMRMGWESEVERKRNMNWETEQMRMGWEAEIERQRRMNWEPEQMRMGWETEVERQSRMGWEHMRMFWETEVERQRKMGWEPMKRGLETEVERKMRMARGKNK